MKNLRLVILVLFVASCGGLSPEAAKKRFQERLKGSSTHWESINVDSYKAGLKYSAVYVHNSKQYEFSSWKGDVSDICIVNVEHKGVKQASYLFDKGKRVTSSWEKGVAYEELTPIFDPTAEVFAAAV